MMVIMTLEIAASNVDQHYAVMVRFGVVESSVTTGTSRIMTAVLTVKMPDAVMVECLRVLNNVMTKTKMNMTLVEITALYIAPTLIRSPT